MLANSVFNDFQNNLIINKSTSKHGKCTLNTLRMIVWFETKWKKVQFPSGPSPDGDLLMHYSWP